MNEVALSDETQLTKGSAGGLGLGTLARQWASKLAAAGEPDSNHEAIRLGTENPSLSSQSLVTSANPAGRNELAPVTKLVTKLQS